MASDEELLSEFRELSLPRRLKCGVKNALDGLGPGERKQLALALEVDAIKHSAVSRWLAKRGVKVADQTIARHRRNECSCRRDE